MTPVATALQRITEIFIVIFIGIHIKTLIFIIPLDSSFVVGIAAVFVVFVVGIPAVGFVGIVGIGGVSSEFACL